MHVENNRLNRIVEKWRFIFILVSIVKLVLMVWAPTYGDLFNWASGADMVLKLLSQGKFPPLSTTGVYGPIELLLAPFIWIWNQLPVTHPLIREIRISSHTTPSAVSLIFLMRLPPLIADITIGVVLLKLVRKMTGSDEKGKAALLLWYVNPFNIFWIEVFGGMDAIPTLVLVLAVFLGLNQKWFKSGISLAIAAVLRVFPLLTFPFFLPAVKAKSRRGYAPLLLGLVIPLSGLLVLFYSTGVGTVWEILKTPLNAPWLLDFLGFQLTNRYIRLVPVLLAFQFYVIICYWKEEAGLVDMVAVSLLAVLGAYVYSGINHHFLWVVPFLTASAVMSGDESWIFVVTFIAAMLSPFIIPFPPAPLVSDVIHFFDPFYAGFFHAASIAYLVKLNFNNLDHSMFARNS